MYTHIYIYIYIYIERERYIYTHIYTYALFLNGLLAPPGRRRPFCFISKEKWFKQGTLFGQVKLMKHVVCY